MTNEQEKPKSDLQRCAYASLAAQLMQSKESKQYAGAATELLRRNLDFGKDGIDLYNEYVNEKQIGNFINIYNKKFNAKLAESNVSEVYNWYKGALDGASSEQKELIKKEFEKYKGENYGKLLQKIDALEYQANAPEGALSKEAKEKAEKELKKYENFITLDKMLQMYTFEALRSNAVKESKKTAFKNLETMLTEKPESKEGGKK